MFIAVKTDDGRIKGKISFYCRVLHVSRQAFSKYLKTKEAAWKYQPLADAMLDICSEDECNDTYGRIRMYQALLLKQPEWKCGIKEYHDEFVILYDSVKTKRKVKMVNIMKINEVKETREVVVRTEYVS